MERAADCERNLLAARVQSQQFVLKIQANDSPFFVGVESSERNSAFAVNQTGNVCRDFGGELFGAPSVCHGTS